MSTFNYIKDINSSISSDVYPELQTISSDTTSLDTKITSTNTKLDTVITNSGDIRDTLNSVSGVLTSLNITSTGVKTLRDEDLSQNKYYGIVSLYTSSSTNSTNPLLVYVSTDNSNWFLFDEVQPWKTTSTTSQYVANYTMPYRYVSVRIDADKLGTIESSFSSKY